MIRAAALEGLENIGHGFFTREGGSSAGLYASLNCGPGSGDTAAAIAANRRLVARQIGINHLLSLHQIHSADVLRVRQPWNAAGRPQADAMVSDRPGLGLGILTADCLPVLLADAKAGVIGAAHAGWKGALGGILAATVEAMNGLGARTPDIACAIGPAIQRASYQVGAEIRAAFTGGDPDHGRFFDDDGGGRYLFDLPGLVAAQARALGIEASLLALDTYADEVRFFSYRRATHRGEADYGRQVSVIALRAA